MQLTPTARSSTASSQDAGPHTAHRTRLVPLPALPTCSSQAPGLPQAESQGLLCSQCEVCTSGLCAFSPQATPGHAADWKRKQSGLQGELRPGCRCPHPCREGGPSLQEPASHSSLPARTPPPPNRWSELNWDSDTGPLAGGQHGGSTRAGGSQLWGRMGSGPSHHLGRSSGLMRPGSATARGPGCPLVLEPRSPGQCTRPGADTWTPESCTLCGSSYCSTPCVFTLSLFENKHVIKSHPAQLKQAHGSTAVDTPTLVRGGCCRVEPRTPTNEGSERGHIQTLNGNNTWFGDTRVKASELLSLQHQQPHWAGTATLGADAGGARGMGTWGAAFWLLSADRRSSRSV